MTAPVPLYRHPQPHRELVRRYREHFSKREYRSMVAFSALLFIASTVVSYYAIQYATERASNYVTDIVLSNVPALDVDVFFVWGTLLFIVYITLLLLAHPKRVPFTLNALGLFYIIRSGFVSLTHLGPFPTQTDHTYDIGHFLAWMLYGKDFFFSGHVGAPFLMALIFWRERGLRYLFLAWSVYMAVIVLLGHLHYSIDVASAYFITFTIFTICVHVFKKAYALFLSDEPTAAA